MDLRKQGRAERVEWIKETIDGFFVKSPSGSINRDKLVAQFCEQFNSTERTGKEILKMLENTNFIIIKANSIFKA